MTARKGFSIPDIYGNGDQLTTKGYGDTKPVTKNTTPEGRANNRRVEIVKR